MEDDEYKVSASGKLSKVTKSSAGAAASAAGGAESKQKRAASASASAMAIDESFADLYALHCTALHALPVPRIRLLLWAAVCASLPCVMLISV